jgi:hypothetical protein
VVWSGTSVIDVLCPLIVTLPATMAHAPVRPEEGRWAALQGSPPAGTTVQAPPGAVKHLWKVSSVS